MQNRFWWNGITLPNYRISKPTCADTAAIAQKFNLLLLLALLCLTSGTYAQTTTFAALVSDSLDDALEFVADGSIELTDSWLDMPFDYEPPNGQTLVGLRFQNVIVPPGAVIVNAYLDLIADSPGDSISQFTVSGQAADNPGGFSASSYDISSRSRTSNTVPWTHFGTTFFTEAYQSPDISSIVQETVTRPGWNTGNSMVFFIEGTSGFQDAMSFDFPTANNFQPLLVIEYETCSNVSDPGSIGNPQSGCGPSFDPPTISNVSSATGGVGTLEYLWLSSTDPDVLATGSFVSGVIGSTYDPPAITQTTYFVRLARRIDCPFYLASNSVQMTVISECATTCDNDPPVLSGVPGNVTVNCTSIPSAAGVSAFDFCDGSLAVTFNESSTGGCPYTITRTWSATDAASNTATATQTITVTDNTAPSVVGGPSNATVSCSSIPSPPTLSATDNCSASPVVTFNESSTSGCPFTITRTWTATDDCGNQSTHTQVLTVIDNINPALFGVPANTTIDCGATVPAPPTVTATDGCTASPVVTFDETIGTGCPYTITRTWTATDDCGNQHSSSQVITVNDTSDPVLVGVPSNTTVDCGAIPAPASVTATDDCSSTPVVTFNETIGTGCPYTITRTWTATDDCGNQSSSSQVITVNDNTLPSLVGVPANTTIDCGATIPSPPTVTATDDCTYAPVLQFDETIGTGCPYTITRTWTAIDDCGNQFSASQVITVDDTTDPVLVGVPSNTTVDCGAIPAPASVTATDDCASTPVVTFNETTGAGCPYTITRTWTATDDCGNQSISSQVITVDDNTSPSLVGVPANTTIDCGATIPSPPTVTATDDCSLAPVVTFDESVGTGCPYTITRTWTAIDDCGNQISEIQVILVNDTTDPVLVGVPSNTTVDCGAIPAPASVTATDDCSLAPVVTFNETTGTGCPYTITRTWTATDDCGNQSSSSQVITVDDNTSPSLVGVPANTTIDCGASIPSPPTVTAIDDCTAAPVVQFNETVGTGCPYTITRTWTAIDDCGNQLSESQVITVDDTTEPVLVGVPSNTTVDCGAIPAPASVTATDDCSLTPAVTFNETVGTGCPYTITRTWTATDDCGNQSISSQVITVDDNTSPSLVGVPANITIDCGASIPSPPTVTAIDDCTAAPVVQFNETVGTGCPYTITRTWTAIDDCGNQLSESQVITVDDTTDPVLVGVPSNSTVDCGAIPAPASVTATDDCTLAPVVTFNETVGTGCPYTITRTWTATDDCGNQSSLTQVITVEDNTSPSLVGVPANTTIDCGASIPSPPTVTAIDDCTASPVVQFNETVGTGCPYTITRTWTTIDDCGNQISEVQVILVNDTTDPVLVGVPANATVDCNSVPAAASVSATDDCSLAPVVTFNETVGTGCPYTITRTWTATDDCGNQSIQTQVLTVEDITGPVLIGVPANVTVDCGSVPSAPVVTATDNCSGLLPVDYNQAISGSCPYTITRTWRATDDCGNETIEVQLLTIVDTISPILSGVPADTSIECGMAIPAVATVSASDDCVPSVSVVYSDTLINFSGTGDCDYAIVRSWMATDACGNQSVGTQQISIFPVGNSAPVALNDLATICVGGAVTYDVLANDSDPDGALDTSSLTILSVGVPGVAIANADGTLTYIHDGSTPGPISIDYQVADDGGLTAMATLEVFFFTQPSVSGQVTNADCGGVANGIIDLSVTSGTGPYTYNWSNGAATQDLTGLTSGSYTVTVTDFNGCNTTASYFVDEVNSIVLAELTTFPASSCVASDGSILIDLDDASAGVPPYSILINNTFSFGPFASEPFILFGAPGNGKINRLSVTDANGCELIETGDYPIGQPDPPAIESITVNDPTCGVTTTGSIEIDLVDTASGGPNYFVKLSNDVYGPFFSEPILISNLNPGIYQKPKIRDGNGCIAKNNAILTINDCPPLRPDFNGLKAESIYRNIWPNPSSGVVNIDLQLSQNEQVTLEVLNAHGQLVAAFDLGEIESYGREIDLSTVAAGLYTLKWTIGGSKVYYDKLVRTNQ